ncbi:hypothetical protein IC232_25205 [Microvirga sp. BT688]|uniref:hypothetical protein n=1 Tax=Microvirga sp. TaxID=1873136 RepID=UPI001681EE38|nr:hypothetical protein [Microvirga sp.]MBD2749975.1 hypothetical protein [Microvirga sp.]
MRKIHPGFTALAILLGPASVIIAHGKITEYSQQTVAKPSDPAAIIRQAHAHCSELPQSQRPGHCDEYLAYFEQCAARKERCDPRSVGEILVRQNLSPAPLETLKIDRIAVSDD